MKIGALPLCHLCLTASRGRALPRLRQSICLLVATMSSIAWLESSCGYLCMACGFDLFVFFAPIACHASTSHGASATSCVKHWSICKIHPNPPTPKNVKKNLKHCKGPRKQPRYRSWWSRLASSTGLHFIAVHMTWQALYLVYIYIGYEMLWIIG